MEDLSRELDESHSQPEAGSEANSGLFADFDDGLEKEHLDELTLVSLNCLDKNRKHKTV